MRINSDSGMMVLSVKESIFLELFQIGMWDKQPNLELFTGLTEEGWDETIQFSVNQGVKAIIFSGAMKLPKDLHPPIDTKLQWIMNVDKTEKRFDIYLNTCAKLVKLYADHDIKTMLLKGIGLAYQYPIPQHREFGDIDIWLFGEHKRADEMIKAKGGKIDYKGDKHSTFHFGGIRVENHRTFLSQSRYKVNVILEEALHEVLKKESCEELILPGNVSVFLPPPNFNAIFLARHMISHFTRGICVRHLSDWSVFLNKNAGKYDAPFLIESFRKAGILDIISALSRNCVDYLGLPKHLNPFMEIRNVELEETMFFDILRRSEDTTDSSNSFKGVSYRWKLFYRDRWRYKLAHDVSTFKIICAYIQFHTKEIFKVFKSI